MWWRHTPPSAASRETASFLWTWTTDNKLLYNMLTAHAIKENSFQRLKDEFIHSHPVAISGLWIHPAVHTVLLYTAGVPLWDRFQKSLPRPIITGKNLPRPAAARAGRIFTDQLSAAGDFSRARSYNGRSFFMHGASDILIKGRHIKSVIISSQSNFLWETF